MRLRDRVHCRHVMHRTPEVPIYFIRKGVREPSKLASQPLALSPATYFKLHLEFLAARFQLSVILESRKLGPS